MRIVFAAALFCAGLCTPVFADDSSAALGMGGLMFTKAADIRMAREDLTISPKSVHIRYAFANDGAKDVTTLVAFPLPDIDTWNFYEEPIGTVGDDPVNFVNFTVSENGKRIPVQVEQKAFMGTRDVTAQILAAGIPVNILIDGGADKLDKLAPEKKKALEKAGLVENEGENQEHPKWTVRTKFYWTQTFPAGKTIEIEHSYTPVTGQTFFGTYDLTEKPGDDGRHWIKDYCMDGGTLATIRKRIGALSPNAPNGQLLNIYSTDFILKTANNWKGGIGTLHLVVDKLKPDNILSLCWDGELKKTGPTTFESTLNNLQPSRDISFVVLENPQP